MKKKILIYQGRPTGGGSKKSLLKFALLLKKQEKYEVKFILGSEGFFKTELDKLNIDYYWIPENIRQVNGLKFRKIKSLISIIRHGSKNLFKIYNVIKTEKTDVVILNESRDVFFLGAPSLLNRKVKRMSFMRGEFSKWDIPRYLISKNIIALSSQLKKQLPYLLASRTKVIPNYIENRNENIKDKVSSSNFNIAFLGSIIPIKNLEAVIDIASKLSKDEKRKYKINIYGDSPLEYMDYKENKLNEIKNKGLNHMFKFHGWIKNPEEQLLENDILILTSKTEGLPRAILESINLGLPIVSYDVGGVRDLVHHEFNGYVVQPGENAKFVKYIDRLSSDATLYTKFSKESLKISRENFSESAVLSKLREVL